MIGTISVIVDFTMALVMKSTCSTCFTDFDICDKIDFFYFWYLRLS